MKKIFLILISAFAVLFAQEKVVNLKDFIKMNHRMKLVWSTILVKAKIKIWKKQNFYINP